MSCYHCIIVRKFNDTGKNTGNTVATGEVLKKQDIKKAGLKITLPRVKILEILEHCEQRHVSAEDVHMQLKANDEEIGLATVYRVLTQFESAGLVERHQFDGGHSVFELNRGMHHDHIVCMKCGKVEEFIDQSIENRQREIAESKGFAIADHSLVIYGDCQKKNCPNLKSS